MGPKGSTQKELEKKSGCKISIRGKGSNWNKNGYDKSYHDENESLHVYLEADTEEQLRKGISIIEPLLDVTSEEHLKQRQNQKMAIANIYGLVKEHGCENCGERGHRTWACPFKYFNIKLVLDLLQEPMLNVIYVEIKVILLMIVQKEKV